MSWKKLLPLGLLALVIGLVVFFPARVASVWLEANTDGISLSGVRGTLLDGHARHVTASGVIVEDVHWNFQPAALLTGRFAAAVRFDTDTGVISATAAYTFWGATHLADVHGSASLGWVAARAGYTFLPVTGKLTLDIDSVTLNDQLVPIGVNGRFRLANVYWQLMRRPLQFGSLRARLEQTRGGLRLMLTDSSGPLAIRGGARFSPNKGSYRVDVRLRARTGAGNRLKNLLNMLGQPNDAGWYRIRQQGRL